MILGYFDESSTHEGSKIVSLCGFLADPRIWDDFDAEWKKLLDKRDWPNRPREFHMYDCVHGTGPFNGWSLAERLAIGVAGSSAYQTVREARLGRGGSMTVAGDRLVFRGYETALESNHRAIRAQVDVYRGDSYLGRYTPGKNQYFAEDQVSNEVSIRHDWLTGGDLFLIADQVNKDGSIDLKALQKPLVNLIWLACFVFLGGALIALWPDAREERRLAERYAGSPVRI